MQTSRVKPLRKANGNQAVECSVRSKWTRLTLLTVCLDVVAASSGVRMAHAVAWRAWRTTCLSLCFSRLRLLTNLLRQTSHANGRAL